MRRHQSLMIKHIGEQQIIHVTAMAGHIYDFMAILRQLAHAFAAVNVDALIKFAPRPAHDAVGYPNRFIGEVSSNLFHQLNGILLRFFMRDFFAARFIFNRFGYRFRLQQLVEEVLTSGQAWTHRRMTLASKVNACQSRQFLRNALVGAVLGCHAA